MPSYIDFKNMDVGDPLPDLEKAPVTKLQLVRYAGASGDFNPIHTDDQMAAKSGLKGVIAQGPLVMGFLGQAITRWVKKRHLKRFMVRFKGMTSPGDIITVSATVTEKTKKGDDLLVVCDALVKDQKGDVKLTGQFEVLQPRQE